VLFFLRTDFLINKFIYYIYIERCPLVVVLTDGLLVCMEVLQKEIDQKRLSSGLIQIQKEVDQKAPFGLPTTPVKTARMESTPTPNLLVQYASVNALLTNPSPTRNFLVVQLASLVIQIVTYVIPNQLPTSNQPPPTPNLPPTSNQPPPTPNQPPPTPNQPPPTPDQLPASN
jgi:hypothetical protein